MPRSFLVKKKPGTCAAWQWKEPEQLQWKQDNAVGKNILLVLFFVTDISRDVFIYKNVCFACCFQEVKVMLRKIKVQKLSLQTRQRIFQDVEL